jgi:hypothetical protein
MTIEKTGRLTYRTADANPVTFTLDVPQVTTASLGYFGASSGWELVVAGGGELAGFSPQLHEVALERFPRGDLALSGVTPLAVDSGTSEAQLSAQHIDAASLLEAARRTGAGGGFLLESLADWRAPDGIRGPSHRTLLGLGDLKPVVFRAEPNGGRLPPGPVSEHVVASAAGGSWYFAGPDSVKVAQRDSNQNLAMASVWPPQGKTLAVRGFDAAGDSIAIVSETEALWCSPPQIGLTLECDTVIADDLPGPVALSPDGRSYWLGMGDGSVRRWQRASPSSVRSELRGIAAAGSELHLLRAFESVLYVGRDKQVDAYSIASVPEKRQSYPFQADAIERCDASRAYALNDGQLVYANGDSDFEVVPDQPAFVRSIACDGAGDLIGVSSRFGAFRLPSPPGWPWQWLLGCLVVVALPALGLMSYGSFKLQGRPVTSGSSQSDKPGSAIRDVVSHILDRDSPKESLAAGTNGQQALVGALRDFLDNEATLPPLTLGVYGAWGSGKSSVMRMLNGELQKTGRYVTVWFNAWRHHGESQLGPALLQNIVREFRRQAGPRVRFYSLLSALRDSRRTFYWGAAALSLALPSLGGYLISHDKRALLGLLGSAVPFWKSVFTPVVRLFSMEPADSANKSFGERIDFLQQFSEEFERVVGSLPKNHYLAIFVDDLDRCPPNRVANVLEALNRLMESRVCFVVLGMDPDTVRRCVEMRYAKLIASLARDGSDRAANFGEQFLEKLVGMAVSVPPVPAHELEEKRLAEEREQVTPIPLATQLRELVKGTFSAALRRMDQVLVTALLVAAAATAFLCWRQDPQRVEGWVHGIVSFDQEHTAGGVKPAADGAAVRPGKAGPQGLPRLNEEALLEPDAQEDPAKPGLDQVASPKPAATPAAPPAPSASSAILGHRLDARPQPLEETNVARITQAHAEPLSREYETAANFNRVLLLGVTLVSSLGFLLLVAMLWQEVRTYRRAPPRKDSAEFAAALKTASARFQNPRQRVRYRNLARLTYHLVAKAHPNDSGWEETFFSLLSSHVLGGDFTPDPKFAWVETELNGWLDRVARTSVEQVEVDHPRQGASRSSGTQATVPRQNVTDTPSNAPREAPDKKADAPPASGTSR